MERYGQRVGEFHKSCCALAIDTTVFLEYAENNTVHAEMFAGAYVPAHFFQVILGIGEIAGARPDQNVDGNANRASADSHQGLAGSDSSAGQVRAEFDTVSAGAFRRDGVLERLHTDFQDARVGHRWVREVGR